MLKFILLMSISSNSITTTDPYFLMTPDFAVPPLSEVGTADIFAWMQMTSKPSYNDPIYASLPWTEILKAEYLHGVSKEIIAATIMAESRNIPYAIRFEPDWDYFPDHDDIVSYGTKVGMSYHTVKNSMATSWGLMQVMGAVAYEYGFYDWFTKLNNVSTGIKYGAMHLATMQRRWGTKPADIYAAYNAGRVVLVNGKYKNQKKVDVFIKYYQDIIQESL